MRKLDLLRGCDGYLEPEGYTRWVEAREGPIVVYIRPSHTCGVLPGRTEFSGKLLLGPDVALIWLTSVKTPDGTQPVCMDVGGERTGTKVEHTGQKGAFEVYDAFSLRPVGIGLGGWYPKRFEYRDDR